MAGAGVSREPAGGGRLFGRCALIRWLISLILLALVYVLTLASFAPWDLLAGLVVSGTVLLVFGRFLFGQQTESMPGFLRRVPAFFVFVGAVLADVLLDTMRVLLVSLRLRPLERAGIVAIPMGGRTPGGVAVTALVQTLAPGSVLIDIDWERQEILFHVLDATDPDRVRQDFEDFYRRYQRHVFP